MTSPRSELFLSNDVFFCYYYDDIILLRLAANKYSQLHAGEAALLHELSNAAADAPSVGSGLAYEDGGAVAERLVEQGVLTRTRDAGKPVAPTAAPLPVEQLVDFIPKSRPRISALHVAAFLWSASVATAELAWIARLRKGFDGPIRRAQRRNARLPPPDETKARELVAVFNDLRIFWPRKFLCRFDSLALIHFLACFGVRAQWVFGVRLDPFGAHCWVQDGRRLYNDDLERIAQYQPIMVVE
jgi:hypothetical protein